MKRLTVHFRNADFDLVGHGKDAKKKIYNTQSFMVKDEVAATEAVDKLKRDGRQITHQYFSNVR